MYYLENQIQLNNKRTATALIASVLIHFLILLIINVNWAKKEVATLNVSLIELPKEALQKKKIVATPQSPETKEKVDTNLLSEKNSKAEKQQIRRGDETKQVAQSAPASAPKPATPNKPTQKVSTSSLRLKDPLLGGYISTTNSQLNNSEAERPKTEQREKLLNDYRPYSKNNSAVLFTGKSGLSDFLPDIPDGDLTLLNTKADQFAVFVRRVALQVFGALRSENWKAVSFIDTRRIGRFATVRATLSPEGKLLKVKVLEGSGSDAFDKALFNATQIGAWDKNPPPEAKAEDGNFHFIFKARTWSQPAMEGYAERRWLLLGTGLL